MHKSDDRAGEIADAINNLVPLTDLRIPGNPSLATIWRWRSKGIKRAGKTILLKSVMVGGRVFSSQAWANDFIAESNAPAFWPTAGETTAVAARRSLEAGRALESLGC